MVLRKARVEQKFSEGQQSFSQPSPKVVGNEPASEAEATRVIPEVVEELSPEELEARQQLELKVERAFFEAGKALRELRDRRLYRSTHRTFEDYCRQRFNFTKASAYYLIAAANVYDNLLACQPKVDILPTKEKQCRHLAKLEPEEQRQVWQEAVEQADGNVPSERIVKGIVDRLKEKPLPQIPLSYKRNDAFILQGLTATERRYNGCWAIAREILDFSLIVETHDGKLQVKPENLDPIDDRAVRHQIAALLKRIQQLRKRELDRGAEVLLESFGKRTFLTEVEEGLLSWLESFYKVS